jgi:hypothetical protein
MFMRTILHEVADSQIKWSQTILIDFAKILKCEREILILGSDS